MERSRRATPAQRLRMAEGLAHIEHYYRSGLRASTYYKEHGLTARQFYTWRRRYQALHPELSPVKAREEIFHKVEITGVPTLCFSGLEIHYPNGVKVVTCPDRLLGREHLMVLIGMVV
jgi:hypothetical protein